MRFLLNRMENLPQSGSSQHENKFYWRFLAYELLYLWSALTSMKPTDLESILEGKTNVNRDI